MDNPLASIVVSNFNYERFLAQAIASALNQTYPNLEVIVVDDGSTDRSVDVIESFGRRITPVFKKNGGMMSAYNAGLRACRGDFIVFLDADDLLLPSALKSAAAKFENSRVAKVHWPLWETNERGQKTGNVIPGQPLLEGDFRERTLLRGPDSYVSPPTSGNAWSRAFLEKVLPAPEPAYRQHADSYLATLAPLFGLIRRIDEPQALYRIHGSNDYASRSTAEKNRRNLLIYDRRCDSLKECLARENIDTNPQRWKQDNRYYAWMQRLHRTTEELTELIPAGEAFLFVDDDQCADRWGGSSLIDGRTALPFLEQNGCYWGPPADDDTATQELKRLHHAGAHFIAFAWPSFWWLEHYRGFYQYLCATFDCVLQNERLVIFDLRRAASTITPQFVPVESARDGMKQVEGIWLPAGDTHFEKMFSQFPKVNGKATYQHDELQACLKHCVNRRVAVDIGAHVGLWSIYLCDYFSQVVAFEPVFVECLYRNLEGNTNTTVHNIALSDHSGTVEMEVAKNNSGATHIARQQTGKGKLIPEARLDDYHLEQVDLIKVDVEGSEYPVLCGARETLLRAKPVVIFERKGHDVSTYGVSRDCVEYLRSLGAHVLQELKKDIIMGWDIQET